MFFKDFPLEELTETGKKLGEMKVVGLDKFISAGFGNKPRSGDKRKNTPKKAPKEPEKKKAKEEEKENAAPAEETAAAEEAVEIQQTDEAAAEEAVTVEMADEPTEETPAEGTD